MWVPLITEQPFNTDGGGGLVGEIWGRVEAKEGD